MGNYRLSKVLLLSSIARDWSWLLFFLDILLYFFWFHFFCIWVESWYLWNIKKICQEFFINFIWLFRLLGLIWGICVRVNVRRILYIIVLIDLNYPQIIIIDIFLIKLLALILTPISRKNSLAILKIIGKFLVVVDIDKLKIFVGNHFFKIIKIIIYSFYPKCLWCLILVLEHAHKFNNFLDW